MIRIGKVKMAGEDIKLTSDNFLILRVGPAHLFMWLHAENAETNLT